MLWILWINSEVNVCWHFSACCYTDSVSGQGTKQMNIYSEKFCMPARGPKNLLPWEIHEFAEIINYNYNLIIWQMLLAICFKPAIYKQVHLAW